MESFDPRARPAPAWTVEEFKARIGEEVGVTAWRDVAQEDINRFARATDDLNFIHVDPERTRAESPLPGTIAHGFWTLSMLSAFGYEVMPNVAGAALGLNYGVDGVRFVTPVPVGGRVRGRLTLAEVEEKRGGLVIGYDVTVEIEGMEVAAGGRPALTARWLTYAALKEAS